MHFFCHYVTFLGKNKVFYEMLFLKYVICSINVTTGNSHGKLDCIKPDVVNHGKLYNLISFYFLVCCSLRVKSVKPLTSLETMR